MAYVAFLDDLDARRASFKKLASLCHLHPKLSVKHEYHQAKVTWLMQKKLQGRHEYHQAELTWLLQKHFKGGLNFPHAATMYSSPCLLNIDIARARFKAFFTTTIINILEILKLEEIFVTHLLND